ncbi:MAG: amino acid--tRNA ligase-related protein [bacterium]|nr:amino acid--tRNA ligase-related protein [bacterium]
MNRTYSQETTSRVGERVRVSGWIASRRDHGKIIFLDLRDEKGVLQVVITPQATQAHEQAQLCRQEWVVEIEGMVQARPSSMVQEDSLTGSVELVAETISILSPAKTPLFALDTPGYEIGEEKRLTYRYLDLRRGRLQKNIRERSRIINFFRQKLLDLGFVEIETPLLTKSTPEGARDFLVPSRLSPGTFYALPQSPQQYKQLLQVAGFERYFQLARALRDEDPRGDRQAEHTQLDVEMSFIEKEDVLQLIETLYQGVVKTLFPQKHIPQTPFPRITYKEAMKQYGTDKPDLRKNKEDNNELAFVFVTDFPAFEWDEKRERWDATHNPFSRSQAKTPEELKANPGAILSHQYDLALNGLEVAGGSLRAYQSDMLQAGFEVMGYSEKQVQEQFGHMIEAFTYGVPPHGGFAGGVDRLCAILLEEPNIREVMAFPKTGDNRELMMGAPDHVSEEQLKELHISVQKDQKTNP